MWTDQHGRVLGDLGYEGEAGTITVGFKKPAGGKLTGIQKMYNKVHNGLRAIGERGNSLLKTTFKALRNVSLCPWKIDTVVAAALMLLHLDMTAPHDHRPPASCPDVTVVHRLGGGGLLHSPEFADQPLAVRRRAEAARGVEVTDVARVTRRVIPNPVSG